MDPNASGFPMQHNPGYPVPTQGNPQQFPYYPNHPSFPQSNAPSQPSFGAVPLQPSGAMMPPNFPQQSPGPQANFSAPFTQPPVTAAFSQPTSSTANIPATQAQSFAQNMSSGMAKSMAPAQQPVTAQQGPPQSTAPAVQSPAAVARDKERVSVLLEINSMLLQEAINLQTSGKAGGPPAQQASQDSNPSPTSESTPDKNVQRSPEYVNCMRRLQVNLAYLATVADKGKKSGGVVPPTPAIMTPPPNLPAINDLYTKLNELFPRGAQGAANINQGSQGNGGPAGLSPTTEHGV
ncbi:uncharacterized protein APUU_40783A [Aspergillus puulaauensis]|uniref:Uncharacterized protein n=1 Tax=Aspergillus puulaauensis TaxID=1220207 RepID=A0A7R8ALU8_9EURO|nr:uncharacterized protein APUU_40783A [Aspergillus puulaauensis]BCS24339.1 hypothetical protein APUU_40783A [Aspergillus puulaauensis]